MKSFWKSCRTVPTRLTVIMAGLALSLAPLANAGGPDDPPPSSRPRNHPETSGAANRDAVPKIEDEKKTDSPSPFADFINRVSASEARVLSPQLEDLGIDATTISNVMQRRLDIHMRANAIQSALLDFSQMKVDYDNMIRKLLPADGYKKYRAAEDLFRLSAELERFNEHLLKRGELIDSDDLATIREAIRRFDAYTYYSTHMPYDLAPNPTARGTDLLPYFKSEADRVRAASSKVVESLRGKIAADSLDEVVAYYDDYQKLQQLLIDQINSEKDLTLEERRLSREKAAKTFPKTSDR